MLITGALIACNTFPPKWKPAAIKAISNILHIFLSGCKNIYHCLFLVNTTAVKTFDPIHAPITRIPIHVRDEKPYGFSDDLIPNEVANGYDQIRIELMNISNIISVFLKLSIAVLILFISLSLLIPAYWQIIVARTSNIDAKNIKINDAPLIYLQKRRNYCSTQYTTRRTNRSR